MVEGKKYIALNLQSPLPDCQHLPGRLCNLITHTVCGQVSALISSIWENGDLARIQSSIRAHSSTMYLPTIAMMVSQAIPPTRLLNLEANTQRGMGTRIAHQQGIPALLLDPRMRLLVPETRDVFPRHVNPYTLPLAALQEHLREPLQLLDRAPDTGRLGCRVDLHDLRPGESADVVHVDADADGCWVESCSFCGSRVV